MGLPDMSVVRICYMLLRIFHAEVTVWMCMLHLPISDRRTRVVW